MGMTIDLAIEIKYKNEKVRQKLNNTLRTEFGIKIYNEDDLTSYGELNDTVSYGYIDELKKTLKEYEEDIHAEVNVWYLERDPDEIFNIGFLNEEVLKNE
jgi:hypothetical protein